ncbi:hypothetical protein MRX96_014477 [Rhipicephalus microplus]
MLSCTAVRRGGERGTDDIDRCKRWRRRRRAQRDAGARRRGASSSATALPPPAVTKRCARWVPPCHVMRQHPGGFRGSPGAGD